MLGELRAYSRYGTEIFAVLWMDYCTTFRIKE
jgi:hypothetical protein